MMPIDGLKRCGWMASTVCLCSIIFSFASPLPAQEIDLREEYVTAVSNEGDLFEYEILYTINKWHYELYPGNRRAATPFSLACLMDPCAWRLADSLNKEIESISSSSGRIACINNWMDRNLLHTQGSGLFAGLPGDDPWGIMSTGGGPTYKKLLPSEMEAMSIYSGRIMGKCYTLANLMITIMVLLGVDAENAVVYQIWQGSAQHAVALARFAGELVLFNDATATRVDSSVEQWIRNQRCFGFFNHFTIRGASFSLDEAFFDGDETLFDLTVEASGVRPTIFTEQIDLLYQYEDREDLVSTILVNAEQSNIFALAKYSYQSLYVRRPEMYLEASMRTSRPEELADSLDTPADIFSWIAANIAPGSIFEDSPERIMTAEQVIVFQTGGLKDQALLALILLKHKGYEPTVYVTRDKAYVRFEDGLYEAGTWMAVDSIEGAIELNLSLDPSVGVTIEDRPEIPGTFLLEQNWPNPFNFSTAISYQLSAISGQAFVYTTLKIYNMLGQEVRTLVDESQEAGAYLVRWDGRNNLGHEVGTGMYVYRLQCGDSVQSRRLLLLK